MGRIIFDNSCRIAYNNCIVWHILHHNTTGSDDDVIPYMHITDDDHIRPKRYVITNGWSLIWLVIRLVTYGSVLTASKVTTDGVCVEIGRGWVYTKYLPIKFLAVIQNELSPLQSQLTRYDITPIL